MSKLDKVLESIRDSDTYNQFKTKYDELDSQAKLYVNLGAVAAVVLFIFFTILYGMAKVNGLKSDINEREELIGSLQRSSDQIKQLKALQQNQRGNADASAALPAFVDNVLQNSALDRSKADVSPERNGAEEKDTHEILVDIKLTQINLKQLTRFLYTLTDQGATRNLNIKDLNVDTKGDPTGWIDATVTVASYKAK
jgi:hypothetical protein